MTLPAKPEQLGHADDLFLTATQINRMKKAASERRGADLKISKTKIEKTAQRGGNLFSTVLGLARPLLAPALATAGLSFGAEKEEVQLYKLTQLLSPEQKKAVEKLLVGKGMIRGGGAAPYGGFLAMRRPSAFLLPLTLSRRYWAGGCKCGRAARFPLLHRLLLPGGRVCTSALPRSTVVGRITNAQSSGGEKMKFRDVPLSKIDLMNWFKYLGIPIKGIFSRNEAKPLHHSPCIINMDDFGRLGTH